MVYIHGMGLGLLMNMSLINNIIEDRETFLIEVPWISFRLCESIPMPEDFIKSIEFMLSRHGLWDIGACFIGHSYGTCILTWILKYRKNLVRSAIFLNPLCFELYNSSLCYKFLYKKPKNFTHMLINYIFAKEMNVALSLTR